MGIGTSSPSYPLDVSGDVRWTGTLQGGSVPWARLASFQAGCPAGQAVQAVGGTLTCVSVGSGTITGVTAGTGLTGGGTSGDVTLDVGVGNGISVVADSVSINSPTCGAGQVSKWTGTAWTCVSDLATGPAGGDLTGDYPNPSIKKWNHDAWRTRVDANANTWVTAHTVTDANIPAGGEILWVAELISGEINTRVRDGGTTVWESGCYGRGSILRIIVSKSDKTKIILWAQATYSNTNWVDRYVDKWLTHTRTSGNSLTFEVAGACEYAGSIDSTLYRTPI